MTKDYFTLGSSPFSEDCAQVGSPEYYELSKIELREFKRMMMIACPPPEDCKESLLGCIAYYAVKSFPHDFGTYHELCAIFNDDSDIAQEWAIDSENKTPEFWDTEAKEAISAYKFSVLLNGK